MGGAPPIAASTFAREPSVCAMPERTEKTRPTSTKSLGTFTTGSWRIASKSAPGRGCRRRGCCLGDRRMPPNDTRLQHGRRRLRRVRTIWAARFLVPGLASIVNQKEILVRECALWQVLPEREHQRRNPPKRVPSCGLSLWFRWWIAAAANDARREPRRPSRATTWWRDREPRETRHIGIRDCQMGRHS